MRKTVTYSHAVTALAFAVRSHWIDVFEASSILASMFDVSKYTAVGEIINAVQRNKR